MLTSAQKLTNSQIKLNLPYTEPNKTRNSSGDEIANANFLRRHRRCIGQRLRPLNRLPNFY